MPRENDNTSGKDKLVNAGVILLAAGLSKRLGRPKQSLLYKGQTLMQHSAAAALASHAQRVLVVLGARADELQQEVKNLSVQVLMNPDWPEGMASSIRCGIGALNASDAAVEGVILMVCDQPFVTPSLLNELLTAHQKTAKPIVACSYADTFGPPVFFHRSFFPALLQLTGDVGARNLVQQYVDKVATIPFPDGAIDIDTEKDYKHLTESVNSQVEKRTG